MYRLQNLEDLLKLGFSDQFGVETLNWPRDIVVTELIRFNMSEVQEFRTGVSL